MTDRERVMKELSWIINNFPKQKDPKDAAEKMCNAINTYCSDALSLLKEQEPRVMTLDEVLTGEDFMWAEIYTPNKWSWCVIYAKISPVVSNDEIVKIEEDCGTAWTKNKSEYGKRGFLDGGWRCWSARPSEQQMRDTPWEDSDEKPV